MRTLAGRFLPVAALCLSSSTAAGQARPPLPAAADTNDWSAYYDRGVEQLVSQPAVADELFRWAARLDPSRPEPLYARWVAFHLRDAGRFARYMRGDDERTLRNPAVLAADSLHAAALARNPFLHRGLLAAAYARLPGYWGNDAATLAFLKYVRGDLEGAAADLGQVVRIARNKVPSRHFRALALANLRRYDEARVELDSVLAALRRSEERASPVYQGKELLMYSIGMLYLAQNRYPEAREALAQAVVEDASQWYPHRGLGLTLRAEGRPDDALVEYRLALELAPDEPLLLRETAEALSDAGQHAAAAEQLTRLVRIAPEWADAWRALGEADLRAGRAAAAAEAYTAYLARARRADAETAARVRDGIERLRAAAPE